MTDRMLVAHDHVQRQLADTLNLYVGQGRRYSNETLADATGIPVPTIKSWREGRATPGMAALLSLIRVLGPVFAAGVMAPAGVSGVVVEEEADVCPRHAASVTARNLAVLLAALEDGRVDHTERPGVINAARENIASLSALVADLEAR